MMFESGEVMTTAMMEAGSKRGELVQWCLVVGGWTLVGRER